MRYLALACDYDGTLATEGVVFPETVAALERLLATGRKLLLVTGREIEELSSVFPHLELFDRVVAENGALLYRPQGREVKLLGPAPPEPFVALLQKWGVAPISVGHAIVATWQPHETAVLQAIRELGLDLQVIFNKDAVMVLPAGVNKATGLAAALEELELSPHNVAAVGDAENDLAMFALCESAVAVDNALPMVKERADVVTRGARGDGVIELIDQIISDDLRAWEPLLARHGLLLGAGNDGVDVHLPPYATSVLIADRPDAKHGGSGKSTVAAALLERIVDHGYQFCVVDPEGAYEGLEKTIVLGDHAKAPAVDEVFQLMKAPQHDVVVNLSGLSVSDRAVFFRSFLPRLQELRILTGRPHWLIVDEADQFLSASTDPTPHSVLQDLDRVVLITDHPEHLPPGVVAEIDTVLCPGDAPEAALAAFCRAAGLSDDFPPVPLEAGELLYWPRRLNIPPQRVRLVTGKLELRPPQA